jgi:hypothetical protein
LTISQDLSEELEQNHTIATFDLGGAMKAYDHHNYASLQVMPLTKLCF